MIYQMIDISVITPYTNENIKRLIKVTEEHNMSTEVVKTKEEAKGEFIIVLDPINFFYEDYYLHYSYNILKAKKFNTFVWKYFVCFENKEFYVGEHDIIGLQKRKLRKVNIFEDSTKIAGCSIISAKETKVILPEDSVLFVYQEYFKKEEKPKDDYQLLQGFKTSVIYIYYQGSNIDVLLYIKKLQELLINFNLGSQVVICSKEHVEKVGLHNCFLSQNEEADWKTLKVGNPKFGIKIKELPRTSQEELITLLENTECNDFFEIIKF